MNPVPPGDVVGVHEPQVGLVDQGCGLQRVSCSGLVPVVPREMAQLLIHQWDEPVPGLGIAAGPRFQQFRDIRFPTHSAIVSVQTANRPKVGLVLFTPVRPGKARKLAALIGVLPFLFRLLKRGTPQRRTITMKRKLLCAPWATLLGAVLA